MPYKKNSTDANRMIMPVYCKIFYQGSKGFDISRHLTAEAVSLVVIVGCFFITSTTSQPVLAGQAADSKTMTVRVTIPPRIQAVVNPVTSSESVPGQHAVCISGRDAGLYRVMAQGLGEANRFAIRSDEGEVPYQVSFRSSGVTQQLVAGEYSRIQRAAALGASCEPENLSQVQVAFPDANQQRRSQQRTSQQRTSYSNTGLRLIISAE